MEQSLLISTLVELADSLVDAYDVIDVLTVLSDRCVEALDVDDAGVLLATSTNELQFVASSSESKKGLELFQIQTNEGPCVDCFRSGKPVVNLSLADSQWRWPIFTPRALEKGFRSVHSLPLRLRGRTIGALNLFRTNQGPMREQDVIIAQGLADVATIAILQHRSSLDAAALNEQLSTALESRIIIEQAKGIVSEAAHCDMSEAFERLRTHSRNHNTRLTDVARAVIEGSLCVGTLDALKRRDTPPSR
jgi:GAF domain-containing protein